jgi:hypothetical protein
VSVASLDAVDRGIPRRLSARHEDRFFDQGMVARLTDRVAVLLDGVELEVVASYDVEKGEIVRQRRDSSGRAIIDEMGTPAFETLKGVVEVRWSKGSAA